LKLEKLKRKNNKQETIDRPPNAPIRFF